MESLCPVTDDSTWILADLDPNEDPVLLPENASDVVTDGPTAPIITCPVVSVNVMTFFIGVARSPNLALSFDQLALAYTTNGLHQIAVFIIEVSALGTTFNSHRRFRDFIALHEKLKQSGFNVPLPTFRSVLVHSLQRCWTNLGWGKNPESAIDKASGRCDLLQTYLRAAIAWRPRHPMLRVFLRLALPKTAISRALYRGIVSDTEKGARRVSISSGAAFFLYEIVAGATKLLQSPPFLEVAASIIDSALAQTPETTSIDVAQQLLARTIDNSFGSITIAEISSSAIASSTLMFAVPNDTAHDLVLAQVNIAMSPAIICNAVLAEGEPRTDANRAIRAVSEITLAHHALKALKGQFSTPKRTTPTALLPNLSSLPVLEDICAIAEVFKTKSIGLIRSDDGTQIRLAIGRHPGNALFHPITEQWLQRYEMIRDAHGMQFTSEDLRLDRHDSLDPVPVNSVFRLEFLDPPCEQRFDAQVDAVASVDTVADNDNDGSVVAAA